MDLAFAALHNVGGLVEITSNRYVCLLISLAEDDRLPESCRRFLTSIFPLGVSKYLVQSVEAHRTEHRMSHSRWEDPPLGNAWRQ